MARNVWDDLVDRLRTFVHGEVEQTGHRTRRFKVVYRNPLVVEAIDGELLLEEGDPDLEIDRAVLADRPNVDDLVVVQQTEDEYAIVGVIAHADA